MLVAAVIVAGVACYGAAPKPAPKSITVGMTLAEAEKIAGVPATLEGKRIDKSGMILATYKLAIVDDSDPACTVTRTYTLTVLGEAKAITTFYAVFKYSATPDPVDRGPLKTLRDGMTLKQIENLIGAKPRPHDLAIDNSAPGKPVVVFYNAVTLDLSDPQNPLENHYSFPVYEHEGKKLKGGGASAEPYKPKKKK